MNEDEIAIVQGQQQEAIARDLTSLVQWLQGEFATIHRRLDTIERELAARKERG